MTENGELGIAKQVEYAIFVFNIVQTVVWGFLIVPTLLLWKHSLLWIALMSVWANFASALAAAVASWIQHQNRRREEASG